MVQLLALQIIPVVHAWPQVPQFAALVAVLEQTPEQHEVPVAQEPPVVPHRQTEPLHVSPGWQVTVHGVPESIVDPASIGRPASVPGPASIGGLVASWPPSDTPRSRGRPRSGEPA